MILNVNSSRALNSTFINRKETLRTISLIVSVNYLALIESHLEYSVSHSKFWWDMPERQTSRRSTANPQPLQMTNGWKIKLEILSWDRDKIQGRYLQISFLRGRKIGCEIREHDLELRIRVAWGFYFCIKNMLFE